DTGCRMSANRILVVDDEPNIVDVVSMALRFHGYAVETAGTGAEALSAVTAFRPDLVVLDVMLPDMEGFEVARRLGAERAGTRSEERRVGKECRSRWSPY